MLTLKDLFNIPVLCSACKAELCKIDKLETFRSYNLYCLYCGSKFVRIFEPNQLSVMFELKCLSKPALTSQD